MFRWWQVFSGLFIRGPRTLWQVIRDLYNGPNLVRNPSFEDGDFGPGSQLVIQDGTSGIIGNWLVLALGGAASVRWIDKSDPVFQTAAEGSRFVDLTGGRPPSATRVLGELVQDTAGPLQAGSRYQCSLFLGVGPNDGSSTNFAGPIGVNVSVARGLFKKSFLFDPPPPIGSGVKWGRFSWRFTVPDNYPTQQNTTISISGGKGNYFIGVDYISIRLSPLPFGP